MKLSLIITGILALSIMLVSCGRQNSIGDKRNDGESDRTDLDDNDDLRRELDKTEKELEELKDKINDGNDTPSSTDDRPTVPVNEVTTSDTNGFNDDDDDDDDDDDVGTLTSDVVDCVDMGNSSPRIVDFSYELEGSSGYSYSYRLRSSDGGLSTGSYVGNDSRIRDTLEDIRSSGGVTGEYLCRIIEREEAIRDRYVPFSPWQILQ